MLVLNIPKIYDKNKMSLNATKHGLKQSKICLKKYLDNRYKTQIKRNRSD